MRRKFDEFGRIAQETTTFKKHETVKAWLYYESLEQVFQEIIKINGVSAELVVYDRLGCIRSLQSGGLNIKTDSGGRLLIGFGPPEFSDGHKPD